jgi:hypothetical protein
MRTIAASLVFSVLMVLTGAAHAVPLRITGGEMTNLLIADGDTFYSFGGNGFAADGVVFSGGLFNDLSGGQNSFSFDASCCGAVTLLRVGALECSSLDFPPPSGGECGGSMELTNTPTPPLDTSAAFDTHSAPFTTIGQLHVGGETFDVVGRGIAEATWCRDCGFFPGQSNQTVRYTFSVDEPPTLLLVVAAFGMLGALFSVRFLRDRYAARLPEHP